MATYTEQQAKTALAKLRATTKKVKPKRKADWVCLECGMLFYSLAAAENATINGCPKCNGVDIDLNV